MACFITIYPQNFAPDVLVFGHDHAAVHTAQCFHRGPGHLPRGLARRDQHDPPAPWLEGLQRPAHRFIRQNRPQTGRNNRVSVLSQGYIHGIDLLVRP